MCVTVQPLSTRVNDLPNDACSAFVGTRVIFLNLCIRKNRNPQVPRN